MSCYYVNLSRLFFFKGDTEKAIEYADHAIALGDVDISEHEVQGDYEQLALALIDISEFERAKAFIHYLQDYTDKAGTEKYVGTFCERGGGSLMILDLDSFKLVNDLYGHQAGDRVLKAFADILKKRCEDKDILCRIGGDEFLVCINDDLADSSVASFTEYLNAHLEGACRELLGKDCNIPIGVSVGAVQIPFEGERYPSLFALADKALYQAKQNGKHGYRLYQNAMENAEDIDPDSEIQRMLTVVSERGAPHGAMTVGQDAFAWIYRYMERYAIRHETNTSICMLALSKEDGGADDAFTEAVYRFQKCLQERLRRNDVILNRQNNTIFLLLPDLTKQNTEAFQDRIAGIWKSVDAEPAISVSYFFRTT